VGAASSRTTGAKSLCVCAFTSRSSAVTQHIAKLPNQEIGRHQIAAGLSEGHGMLTTRCPGRGG